MCRLLPNWAQSPSLAGVTFRSPHGWQSIYTEIPLFKKGTTTTKATCSTKCSAAKMGSAKEQFHSKATGLELLHVLKLMDKNTDKNTSAAVSTRSCAAAPRLWNAPVTSQIAAHTPQSPLLMSSKAFVAALLELDRFLEQLNPIKHQRRDTASAPIWSPVPHLPCLCEPQVWVWSLILLYKTSE